MKQEFIKQITQAYTHKGASITLGAAMLQDECLTNTFVNLPLKNMNRHGLIAGATGTGKTKTLQLMIEGLSKQGVPVLVMDVKGDLSGLAAKGVINDKINERHTQIGIPYQPLSFPVELLSLSNDKGAKLRATVSEFGPVLLSKMLGLNDTQSGLIAMLFKFCDDKGLPILDLKDLKRLLQYVSEEGKNEIEQQYGKISTTSTGTILRKVIELEQQGADKFFGELSFDVNDLLNVKNGLGQVSVVRLTDIQDRPKLFSTFMLCLLAEIYANYPEIGDADKPKLVIFIDEAHLVFEESSKALLDQIESIVKLIRSKGVGIIFCTQNPTDIPDAVLSQLGLKIQHALRAFTAKDRKAIKQIAENYPTSEYYKTDELLTSLGIGQAAVTVLDEKGIPTPLVATMLCAPQSRMGILTEDEIDSLLKGSSLKNKYDEVIDRDSAFEILSKKLKQEDDAQIKESHAKKGKEEKSTFEKVLNSPVTKQIGRSIARELTRSLLGVLGISGSRRR